MCIHIDNISNTLYRSLSRFPPKFQCRDVLRMKSVLRHSCAHADDFQTALKDTGLRASAHRIATAAERGEGRRWDKAGDLRAEPIKNPSHAPTSCFPRANKLSLISACAAGYCWRGLEPASPSPFPCWHHQGGLPYSRGAQFQAQRGCFDSIFSFQTSKPQIY